MHQQMLDDRTQRDAGKERQRADHDYGRHQQAHEERAMCRQRAGRCRHSLLRGQAARRRQRRNDEQEPPEQHREAERQVVPGRVGGDAGERAAVVPGAARVRIQNLAEAVRAAVVQVRDRRAWRIPVAALRERRDDADARNTRMQKRRGKDRKQRHLDFLLLDLLADVLRRSADHQPGDEDADDGVEQHAVEARADAAEDHFVGLHVEQRHQAAERRVAVVHAVDGAAAGVGRDGGKERRCGDAEARFLALHVPARLRGRCRALDARACARIGLPACSAGYATNTPIRNITDIAAEERPALPRVLDHVAERVGQARPERRRSGRSGQVRERRRALERVRRVGVEEAAAVRAQLLDGFLRRHRPLRDRLRRAFDRLRHRVRMEVLNDALRAENKRGDDGDRQQDVQRRAGQVHPEVADRARSPAGQSRGSARSRRRCRRRPTRSSARPAPPSAPDSSSWIRRCTTASSCWS